ncbi:iron-containing alcohol dehydrogenase [Micromonospora sp. STR1s_5]|nr:iron-containing alcohol dehydrogenase [Micromonospora sp. STR1s_5]
MPDRGLDVRARPVERHPRPQSRPWAPARRCRRAPHGLTSCVVLQHVVGFNHEATSERQASLLRCLGSSGGDTGNLQEALLSLARDQLGLPWRLRDLGLNESDLPLVAAASLQDPIVATNPRPIRSVGEVEDLLRRAW